MREVTLNFIWLGERPLPAYAYDNILMWNELHPDWRLIIWNDSTRPKLFNEAFYEMAPNLGERSDILRLELLQRTAPGDFNLYLDLDVKPLRQIDELIDGCDFLLTVSRSFEGREGMYAENAVMGSVPRHPLLMTAVKELARHKQDVANWRAAGTAIGWGTVYETGPRYLQRVMAWHFGSNWGPLHEPVTEPTDYDLYGTTVRVLPYTAFYPNQHQCLPDGSGPVTPQYIAENPGQYPHTYGIHYCAGEWLPLPKGPQD